MTPPFVKRYLIALDRHKLIGLTSFVLIVGISGVVAMQPAPPQTYKAKGALAYTTPATSFSVTGEQIQQQGRQVAPEMLLTDNAIALVAAQVKAKPKEIVSNLKVKWPKEDKKNEATTSLIQMEYTEDNPKKAEAILNVLMQKMIEQSRLVNTTRLRAVIESIEKRLPEAKKELAAAEQQLERYDRVEGPALLAAEDGSLVNSITGSQQQQRQLELTLSGVETQIASLVNKLGLTPEQAYTSSALSADPIIGNLRSQILQTEAQIEILSRDLRAQHPRMIELRRQQDAYNKLLQERAREVLGGNGIAAPLPGQIRQDSSLDPARQQLALTLVNLQTQRDTLKQQLVATKKTEEELRREYQTLPNKQLDRVRLAQQLQLKQDFYNKLQAGLADAKAAEAETVSSLSIAQPLQVRVEETKATQPTLVLGVGTFVAFMVAGGVILLLATLDNTFYTPEEMQQAMLAREVSVLAELPFVVLLPSSRSEAAILTNPNSPYLEFYERFRSSLRRVENKSLKVLLLTSTVEGEGKTVSAYNLAIASAQAGKRTLLVEADLRSPSFVNALNLMPDPDASIEPLRYYSSGSGCIYLAPGIENLYIVPSPGPQRQAAAILESSELRQFLEDARGRFDFVVIDTPPLSRCNDALLLEPLSDGMVLVTRPSYTQESILTEAIDELIEAELPLLGAVINGVDKPIPIARTEEIHIQQRQDETEALERQELDRENSIPTEAMKF